MAGMKKGTAEWLTGYSVQNLSEHWVFDPFKYFLTVQQTDYLVVHWFVFVFDLTVALWMMWSITRHVAMVFCALFHLMNSRLFRIGMFPWVCLATMPLFYPFDWPKTIASYAFNYYTKLKRSFCYKIQQYRMKSDCDCKINNSDNDKAEDETMKVVEKEDSSKSKHNIKTAETNTDIDDKVNDSNEKANIDNVFDQDKDKITKIDEQKPINEPEKSNSSIENNSNKNKVTIYLILLYVFIQAFLPYSHFITKERYA